MQSSKLTEAITPSITSQARYPLAAVQARRTLKLVIGLSAPVFLMLLAALLASIAQPDSRWVPLLCSNASALILLAVALQNANSICQWRTEKLTPSSTETPLADEPQSPNIYQRLAAVIPINFQPVKKVLVSQGIWLGSMAVLVLIIVIAGWGANYVPLEHNHLRWVATGCITLTVFATLVVERHLDAINPEAWPEAKLIVPLLRLVMGVMLLTLPMLIFASISTAWLINLPAILVILAAIEFLLRGLFSLFTPPVEGEPAFLAKSQLAAQLTWPPRPLRFLQQEIHQHFGIDLRQLWAFTVLRRAFLPLLAMMLLCGWLLTSIQQISTTQRGIYERFGRPVSVLPPGLHLGLPWPFGQVRIAENGQVHELAAGEESGSTDAAPLVDADSAAPDSADRLWDASHNFDKAQIIASQSGQQQSLQIINTDVRFMWRVGLTDEAAMAATYHSADLPDIIRSVANQVLVSQFASLTLNDVLGEQRNDLARQINQAVGQQLAKLDTGVELLSTVVEAIHPPAGAANAFHGVQAAQIAAQSLIFHEQGHAAELAANAASAATARRDSAQINASQVLSKAQATAGRFAAQKDAHAVAGQVYIDELWFKQLQKTLGTQSVLVIDNRIGAGSPPTIDLRQFPSVNDAAQRDTPAKSAQESSQ